MSRMVKWLAHSRRPEAALAPSGALPPWAVPLLGSVLQNLADVYWVKETERTRGAQPDAEPSIRRESVGLVHEAIGAHLSSSFAERRALVDGLLVRLDAAMVSRDAALVGALLRALVEVVKANPLAELADLLRVADGVRADGMR